MAIVKGTQLTAQQQREALSVYVHRFTGDHKPLWSNQPMPNGEAYPLQFANDQEWLANTTFSITRAGKFDRRITHCTSNPTWPNNPELRRS